MRASSWGCAGKLSYPAAASRKKQTEVLLISKLAYMGSNPEMEHHLRLPNLDVVDSSQ